MFTIRTALKLEDKFSSLVNESFMPNRSTARIFNFIFLNFKSFVVQIETRCIDFFVFKQETPFCVYTGQNNIQSFNSA